MRRIHTDTDKGAVKVRRIGNGMAFSDAKAGAAWKTAAAIGLLLFLLIQVRPLISHLLADSTPVLTREAAAEAAEKIARERFGVKADRNQAILVHLSDKRAWGYFSKEDLLDTYIKTWLKTYPADVYRADLPLPEAEGTLTLFLDMETGRLAGFRDADATPVSAGPPEDPAAGARLALEYAARWGHDPAKWQWDGHSAEPHGYYTFFLRDETVGEARVLLKVRVPAGFDPASEAPPPWKNGMVEHEIRVPDAIAAYMDRQEEWADRMNTLGFIVPQLVMVLLAVTYAALLRRYSSPRRGALLSVLFFVLYCIFYINMMPGFYATLMEEGVTPDRGVANAILTFNLFLLAGMTLFTYFSAVAGDGLWRSMGFRLWPRWRDADFGAAVWNGMKQGYMLAPILLGAQSVILFGLEWGIGMFYASDVTQSAANMTVSGLLILLAWCAGIAEELQSRLFGIALFRSWLVDGARRLMGRPISPRTENALTVLAMLPPGLIWAFGHVGYAVYPAYSRLIELTILALMLGWFMLRFGFIAVMFAHIILNSALMGMQILLDGLRGDEGFAIAGLILPFAVAFLIRFAHRRWGRYEPYSDL